MNKKISQKGFTLIELLVAIAILGILTLIALPIVSNLQEKNENSTYKKYGDTMVTSAKLYVDAYAIDMFGYEKEGCYKITFDEMKKKNLLKDIQTKDANCANDDTFILVKNSNGKYQYQESLKCFSDDGKTLLYDKTIPAGEEICNVPEGEQAGPTVKIVSTKKKGKKIPPIYIQVDDPDKLPNSNKLSYGWSTKANDSSSVKKWYDLFFGDAIPDEYVTDKAYINNYPSKTDKDYYLYVKGNVQDVLTNTRSVDKFDGPFEFDDIAPECPAKKAIKGTPSIGSKTNGKATLKIDFTNDDATHYKLVTKYKTTTKGKVTSTTSKKKTITPEIKIQEKNDGYYTYDIIIYDAAGNNSTCKNVANYQVDKTAPKVTITAYQRNKTTKKNGSKMGTVTAQGTTQTLETGWANNTTAGINFEAKISDNTEIKSITFEYNKPGLKKVKKPSYTEGGKRTVKTPDSFYLDGDGYRQGRYVVTDTAGNKTTVLINAPIDKVTPTLTITAYKRKLDKKNGDKMASVTANNTTTSQTLTTSWVNASTDGVNYTVSTSDKTSGLNKAVLKYNASGLAYAKSPTYKTTETRKATDGSDTFSLTSGGYRQALYTVTDKAGNSAKVIINAPIDKSYPSITITAYKRKDSGGNGTKITSAKTTSSTSSATLTSTTWINASTAGANLSVSASDNGKSGLSSATWKYDGSGNTKFYDNPTYKYTINPTITDGADKQYFESSGYRHGKYTVTDKAGNTSTIIVKLKLDRTKPAKPSSVTNSSSGKCTTKNIKVTAKSSDGLSGIAYWQYKFGSGSWNKKETTEDFSIKLTSNRTAKMYIRAVDKAGNASSSASTSINKKSNCNSYGKTGFCAIRSKKERSTPSWYCYSCHRNHNTGYRHYCVNSSGNLCVPSDLASKLVKSYGHPKYPTCDKYNRYNFVCPVNPYPPGWQGKWKVVSD